MPDNRTILVTGGGGFIGGRMVEVMHSTGFGDVRAGVRRWASGARIGRLPVDLVHCDIMDRASLDEALAGVTHVVHCAVGDRDTTVNGTKNVLEAAKAAGVERVVHLSTVDVYGTPEGSVAEDRKLAPTGKPYGDMKLEAEQVCVDMASKGVHVTMLRPSLVHGPFSATWTMAYAERLQRRPWLVADEDAQGTCNLVYVDDLVGAVMAAFTADIPGGEAFNINGPDRATWAEYFRALNGCMGLPDLDVSTKTGARATAGAVQPLRQTAKFLIKHFEAPIKGLAQSSPMAREAMVKAEKMLKTTPAPTEFAVYSRKVSYESDKAQSMLGWEPKFPLSEAMPLTGAWLKHHHFVKNGRS